MRWEVITSKKDVARAIKTLQKSKMIGLDTETTGLDWWRCGLTGISAATMTEAFYFPFGHMHYADDALTGDNLPQSELRTLREGLQGLTHVGANLNFDRHILKRRGWTCGERKVPYHDVTLAAYALDENLTKNGQLKLEALAERFLKIPAAEAEEALFAELARVLGKKKASKEDKALMRYLDVQTVGRYAAADAWHCMRLFPILKGKLKIDHTWNTYLNQLEYRRQLFVMEENGIPYLPDVGRREWEAAKQSRAALLAEIVAATDGKVQNPGSPKQLQDFFGIPSSAKAKLENFAADSNDNGTRELIHKILKYRRLDKACGTYYKAIDRAVGDGDVLHPSLRITGAVVRLSASNPNTQAIPRAGSEEYKIKDMFGSSDPDIFMIETDLSQAEIVMGAHITKDPTLIKAVTEGLDLHQAMIDKIAELYGKTVPRVTAKAVNFSAQYGVGAYKLATILRIPQREAAGLLEAHHELYPLLTKCYSSAQHLWARQKFLRLWSGRKRHWGPAVKKHTALNALIQGGVTELMRVATVRLAKDVPELRQCLTVHDCVVGTMHRRDITPATVERIQKAMTTFPHLSLPIKASVEIGRTWGDVVCADKWFAQQTA